MIHRAPLGSMERFIGVLIEHFAGAFPLWLAPEQARVITVSEKSEEYGRQVEQKLRAAGLRVKGDYRPEKLGAKIRDGQFELIPYMLVVGPRDAEARHRLPPRPPRRRPRRHARRRGHRAAQNRNRRPPRPQNLQRLAGMEAKAAGNEY